MASSGDESAASRRLAVLAQQLAATQLADSSQQAASGLKLEDEQLSRQLTGGQAGPSAPNSSYASIDGRPSSYARVHGEVSRAPANWRLIPVVAKEELQEVQYHKAEGIAKVGKF